ncbi:SpoVR family protein [Rugamonas apoptosis]|uniref:SpoVR family protein n=1 Tax=Rugamonas apoptosis TaxID=2758570 RepID=A0A7W2IK65_9BURK|nr:SpoVR family protein [Rugamonas apoptosis]MBA5687258.1 SpoVR family protein [Rugamonas apoptosis]
MSPSGHADWQAGFERLARAQGLDCYPIDFSVVPASFMLEIAAYGLPIRMPHWSFGARYVHQLVRHHMGHSHVFEVMFPGDPCRAYLLDSNSAAENALVTAHVIGHADFVKRNALFRHCMDMTGGHVLERSAVRARRVEQAIAQYGPRRVETVLDAALALESHIDVQAPLHRPDHETPRPAPPPSPSMADTAFWRRYRALVGAPPLAADTARPGESRPSPEPDLLWFIAHHGPELEDWEREIFLAVREEAYYFYPVHACQIMNEGWASYWHARLLREADFLPQACWVQAIKSHSDVVSPYGDGAGQALSINPYHLGFALWEHIVARDGLAAACRVCTDEDDTGFIRNHLDRELADQLDLFVHATRADGETRIMNRDLHAIHEAILAPTYHYGAPSIVVSRLHHDGSLELTHDARRDGRGLDVPQAEQVLAYIAKVWRRPVVLHTVDFRGVPRAIRGMPTALP